MKLRSPSLKKMNSFFFSSWTVFLNMNPGYWMVCICHNFFNNPLIFGHLGCLWFFPISHVVWTSLYDDVIYLEDCCETDAWEWNGLSKGKHIQNLRGTVNCPLKNLYNSDLDISIRRWECPSPAPTACLNHQKATLDIKNHLYFCQSNRWKMYFLVLICISINSREISFFSYVS